MKRGSDLQNKINYRFFLDPYIYISFLFSTIDIIIRSTEYTIFSRKIANKILDEKIENKFIMQDFKLFVF